MASIVDRGKARPKRWQVKYRVPGTDQQRSRSFASLGEAKRFAGTVAVDIGAGTFIDPRLGKRLFGDFAEQVWPTLQLEVRHTTTARNRSALDTWVLPRWENVPLGAITHDAAQEWVTDMAGRVGPGTVQKQWQVFAKIVRAAVDAHLITGVPWGTIRLPKIERHEARFLEPADVKRLADAIGDEWRAFIYVGALCGLRAGELFGLRWDCVDFDQATIEVRHTVTEAADATLQAGPPKTKAGRRRVPMPQVVVDELELHRLTAGDPEGFVWAAVGGGPTRASNFRTRVWQPACHTAGLDGLVMHELRHTAVAHWIEAGAEPKQVADRAGHRSIVTIYDIYGHLFPQSVERVNVALDAMYREQTNT